MDSILWASTTPLYLDVSGQIYIGGMKKSPASKQEGNPVFIEVPKPVSSMSAAEKDDFVEEILKAIEEQCN